MTRTALLALAALGLAAAETAPTRPWSDKASLGFVAVSGNAQSQSLGFTNEFLWKGPEGSFQGTFSGVRVATTTTTRLALGTSTSDYVLTETRARAVTSEAYTAGLRCDQKLRAGTAWFLGLGWEQNRPAGLAGRTAFSTGLNHAWIEGPATKLRVDAGLGYTSERKVYPVEGGASPFGTWRVASRLDQKLSPTSGLVSELAFTDSLRDRRDGLAVWKNALTSKINGYLALKVGLDLTYDNTPASVGVDVVEAGSTPPVVLGKVPVELRKLDSLFTTSLVVTF